MNHFVGNSLSERISATTASVLPVSHLPETSGALLAASRSPETFSQETTAEEDEDTYYSSDDDFMSFSSATQPSIKEPSRQEVPY